MSNFKSKNIFSENRLLAFLILLLVAFLMHFLALQFIYPGFYRPLDPLHSDHYLAAAFANGPVHYPWLGFLRWARPVFMLFYKCIGYAGIHGSIVCIIALLFVSIAMTATVIRRIFDLPFNLPFVLAYGLYCFMVFSQPFMYCQYTEDVGALLCYFFLVLGVNFFSLTLDKSLWKSFIPLLVCCLLAFLSKETYALAALFFSFLWFIYYRKQSISKAVIPAAAVVLGLIMSSIYNRWVHSVFIDPIASSSQPYYIDMSPSSVINQWLTYAGEGLNIANVLVVLFILFLSFRTNKDKAKSIYTIVGSLAGAGLAWIPNSLLPNHHFPGYVFNGI